MKKKTVGNILLVILILFISFLSIKINERLSHANRQHVGEILDSNILSKTSTLLGSNDQINSRKVLLVQFSPECDYCQFDAAQIVKRNDTSICFIFSSGAPKQNIWAFVDKYALRSIKHCIVASDEGNHIAKLINCSSIPGFVLYDKNHRLQKKFCGSIKLSLLLDE